MFLVHVVARLHLFVLIAQFQRKIRITFQIDGCWNLIGRGQREDFACNFENENIVAEWGALSGGGFAQAKLAKRFQIHQEIRDARMLARSLIAMRSCFIESRSRNVTVSRRAASFSPNVSKSIVTPKGVPTSS